MNQLELLKVSSREIVHTSYNSSFLLLTAPLQYNTIPFPSFFPIMLQSELHSILEAKHSPSNQPLFIIVHEENGLLAQLQIRITDGTQHWSGHIVADDIQASNDEMRTQKFTLTRSALKPPTNELALHCDLQPSSNSLKILVKQRVQNSNVQKQISSLLIPRTSDEISLFRILSASNVQLNRNVAQLQDHNLKLEYSLRENSGHRRGSSSKSTADS